jgi:TldD protein
MRACCLVGLTSILCGPPTVRAFAATPSAVSPSSATAASAKASPGGDDIVLTSMEKELHRAGDELGKLTPSAYFISYTVYDEQVSYASGMNGTLSSSATERKRTADVIMRVGSAALDNAHGENRPSAIITETLPLDDDSQSIAHALWRLTFNEYRRASASFLNVQTKAEVKAKEDDLSADFSRETAQKHLDYKEMAPAPEQKGLEAFVRRFSAPFAKYPYIYASAVAVTADKSLQRFVSSEGGRVVMPDTTIRVVIQAETRADDGMELMRVETMQAESMDRLPPAAEIDAKVENMARDLKALREAPVAEPYDGPALLSGRASGVFFHEVLGHRLEGQRQRGDDEGQTFTKMLNHAVLPEFLSVTDDPTLRTMNGIPLAGWYEFDDEGVPASRVEVIKKGVLRNFLMSRMPIAGFDHSNGHGRSQTGYMPVGRQGNLIVSSTKTVKDSELRKKLLEEVKRQGKPYGLYFEDIQGGFTLTQRSAPQAFQVLPVMVWRVYANGRPDELVRGVDIVGTPLVAMNRIEVTGDTTSVFNGVCGAESGSVAVSAAAPAILFSEIETQKRSHSNERLPILPPPGFERQADPPTRAADSTTRAGDLQKRAEDLR